MEVKWILYLCRSQLFVTLINVIFVTEAFMVTYLGIIHRLGLHIAIILVLLIYAGKQLVMLYEEDISFAILDLVQRIRHA